MKYLFSISEIEAEGLKIVDDLINEVKYDENGAFWKILLQEKDTWVEVSHIYSGNAGVPR